MTIEINERERNSDPAELPGIILVLALVALLTAICWLTL